MKVPSLADLLPRFTTALPADYEELVDLMSREDDRRREEVSGPLWSAYQFSREHHLGQLRQSGSPYFEHVVATARYLAEWRMDLVTVMAGLLHDTLEDTRATREELSERFGDEVADLVEGVTKLGGIRQGTVEERQAENLMKMLLSMTRDLRVIIIKFADRLHNMETIEFLPQPKQQKIAQETGDVYSPLAHRLGMFALKNRLDDLALKILQPEGYEETEKFLKRAGLDMRKSIEEVVGPIRAELETLGWPFQIKERMKSQASIWKKTQQQDRPMKEIYDILAVRIIVRDVASCYGVLGVVHQLFSPLQHRFKDFIAMPKRNGYRSLHTTVIGPSGRPVEIQIRTEDMDETAEIGVAAHWRYKEGNENGGALDSKVKWLRDLVGILQDESQDPEEFLHLLQIDLYQEEVFLFTPKGALISLPAGATAIDFAYAVHTQVGHHAIGAKMDGRVIPLNAPLKSGATVEIITSDRHWPSYAWLKIVRTSRARNAIRRWLLRQERELSYKLGKEVLEKTLRRLKLLEKLPEIIRHPEKLGFGDADKLYAAVGTGQITVREILRKFAPAPPEPSRPAGKLLSLIRPARKSSVVRVSGVDGIMTHFAKCCNPIPGDQITGFVTHGRGITVHRAECRSLVVAGPDAERLIDTEWDVSSKDEFPVSLKLEAQDRKGYLKDVTVAITGLGANLTSVDMKVEGGVAVCSLTLTVPNTKRLGAILTRIKGVAGTIFAERMM